GGGEGERTLAVTITAERDFRDGWTNPVESLALAPPNPALFHGYVKVETASELDAQPTNTVGLIPIETKFLPEAMRAATKSEEAEPLAFRFHGSEYRLPLRIVVADPEA